MLCSDINVASKREAALLSLIRQHFLQHDNECFSFSLWPIGTFYTILGLFAVYWDFSWTITPSPAPFLSPKGGFASSVCQKSPQEKEILWTLNVNLNMSWHQVDLLDLIQMLVNLDTNVDVALVEDLDRGHWSWTGQMLMLILQWRAAN